MTAYAMLHGYVLTEITGIEINGRPFSVGDILNMEAVLAATRPAEAQAVAGWEVCSPTEYYISEFVDGVVGIVEATSFEQGCLWETWQRELGKSWVSDSSSRLPIVAIFGGKPVTLSMFCSVVDGHKILFIDSPSQVVHHELIEEWLKLAMPKSAFRDGGEYLNKTDAGNFHNVFPRLSASPATGGA